MTDATLIADLIRAGLDPELVGRVANAIAEAYADAAAVCGNSADKVDISAERRRAKDRERKRNISRIPQNSAEFQNALLTKEDSKKDRKRKGERLSAEWKPTEGDLEFALSKGMPKTRIDTEVEKFRNYWTAKSGHAAAKLDWPATWRNWVLSSLERSPGNPTTAPPNGGTPAYLTPPPGAESLEEIRRKFGGQAANGTQVRRDT